MTRDQILTLYDYNCWANGRVLAAVLALEEQQFLAPARQSHGSLRANLVHTLAVEWMWRMRCQKGVSPPQYVPAERFLQAESVQVAWREEQRAMQAFLDGLDDADLAGVLEFQTRHGVRQEMALWLILWHVVNHSSQHRGEIAANLVGLGQDPGDLDIVYYFRQS